MPTRVNTLTDEQRKVKAPKKAKATKKAKAPKKALKAKKIPICASFPPDLVALNNEAKTLQRTGQKKNITGEMKNAMSIIKNMYKNVKATPKKKERVVKAKPTTNVRDEEHQCWIKHKNIEKISILGAKTVELNKIRCNLRTQKRENEVTEEMKEAASKFRSLDRKQEKDRLEKKVAATMARLELLDVSPAVPKRNALEELTAQHADDVTDEVFNVNWRPTPALRRFKLKFNLPLPF